jgi:hypothetical protein
MHVIWIEVGKAILENTAINADKSREKMLQIAKDMAYLGIGTQRIQATMGFLGSFSSEGFFSLK